MDDASISSSQSSDFTMPYSFSHLTNNWHTISHVPLKRPFFRYANDVEKVFQPPPAKRQWHENISASRNPIHILQLYCSNHSIPVILRSSIAARKQAKMGRVWEAEVIVEGWYFKTKGVYYKSKKEAERVVSDAAGWWLVFATQGPQAEEFERMCVYQKKEICPEVSIAIASMEQMMQLVPLRQDINLGISRSGTSKSGQGKKKGKKNKSDPPKLEQPDLVFEGPVKASREVLNGRRILGVRRKGRDTREARGAVEGEKEAEEIVRYRR